MKTASPNRLSKLSRKHYRGLRSGMRRKLLLEPIGKKDLVLREAKKVQEVEDVVEMMEVSAVLTLPRNAFSGIAWGI